jgi:nitroimidazol reductase NimA-like FMN-containing flavoprotein (pyridoxamine 5'-phosphate oxidase superfamily)
MQTERTTVRRLGERGVYNREEIYAILDEGLVCHVGFVADGQPFVIPMSYARVDDRLILHGSVRSRLMRAVGTGVPVCVTVTLLDGVVLARSLFDHSMNYRTVVVLGRATTIDTLERKREALLALTDHLVPGRTEHARGPSDSELKATAVLEVPLEEASAKVRTGPPGESKKDTDPAMWAGVIPLRLEADPGVPDDLTDDEVPPPAYVDDYAATRRRTIDGESE